MSKKIKKRHVVVLAAVGVVLGFLILFGHYFDFLPRSKAGESQAQASRMLMDTVVDVRVDGRQAEEQVLQAFSVMEDLEATLSRFIATSEVTKINDNSGQWVTVSPITLNLIEMGIEMGRLSGGAFDITMGPLLDLWGFGSGKYFLPSEEELLAALSKVDYTKVEINKEANEVRIPAGFVLDLGGIAKGFIVDQGIELLQTGKIKRAIINAGGDIRVIGTRPDGNPWRVGVQNPDRPAEISWILLLDNSSVVTSGDYQRYFTIDDQRFHHIIDPQTGYPAKGLRSVTVVGKDTATCDALSTAIFVLGWEKGKELVESLDGVEAILVKDTEVWISPGLAELVIVQ